MNPVVGAIERSRRVLPEQRVGQVISNALGDYDAFYLTDEELASIIHDYLDRAVLRPVLSAGEGQ